MFCRHYRQYYIDSDALKRAQKTNSNREYRQDNLTFLKEYLPEQKGAGSSVFEPLARGGSFDCQRPIEGGSSYFKQE